MHERYLNCRRHIGVKFVFVRRSKTICVKVILKEIKLKIILIFFWYWEIFWKWQARKLGVRNFHWLNVIALSRTETDAPGEDAKVRSTSELRSYLFLCYDITSRIRVPDRSRILDNDSNSPRICANNYEVEWTLRLQVWYFNPLHLSRARGNICNNLYIVSAPNYKLMLCKTNASLLRFQNRRPRAAEANTLCDYD